MRLDPKPSRRTRVCKLKRVYPRLPLHVHSAGQERLTGTASGNPASPKSASGPVAPASEWSADRLRIRLESELSSEAWRRLELAARRRGASVEELLSGALAEAS
jgi:hypothetical protein